MAEKLFYSMGEVAEMFDVKPSLLRHWESQFSVIRPKRNKKGNRLFTPQDVENLKLIYHLVKERGMTLDGAKKALRQRPAGSRAERDAELLERLQRVRALLAEVREDLRQTEGAIVPGQVPETVVAPAVRRKKAVVKVGEDGIPEGGAETPAEEPAPGGAKPASRRPRRKKEEPEHKELFAFYEQSLF